MKFNQFWRSNSRFYLRVTSAALRWVLNDPEFSATGMIDVVQFGRPFEQKLNTQEESRSAVGVGAIFKFQVSVIDESL